MLRKFGKLFSDRGYEKKNHITKRKEEMHKLSRAYLCSTAAPVWSGKSYRDVADYGYSHNVIAHRAVNMIAKAASSIPLKLQRKENGVKYPVHDHEVLDLLSSPNSTQGGREFFENLYSSYLISGNAYILGVKSEGDDKNSLSYSSCSAKIREMYMLRPDRVEIIAKDSFHPLGYRYKANNVRQDYMLDENGVSQVLHFKNFHPLSDWYGLSPLEVATFSIDQHNQASAWNQALLQNGARPSGAIMVKNSEGEGCRLSSQQLEELRNMFSESLSGAENAGRPLLLEGGLEWKEMSLSPRDMDYIESKNSSAREIALAIGVPPQLLGIPGDNTYSNLSEARVAMWEQTIIPMVENFANHMTRWIQQNNMEDNIEIIPDISNIGVLGCRVDNHWERLCKNTFMTINEKRQAIGLEPIAEGDKIQN